MFIVKPPDFPALAIKMLFLYSILFCIFELFEFNMQAKKP